jgi:hypothetical protein
MNLKQERNESHQLVLMPAIAFAELIGASLFNFEKLSFLTNNKTFFNVCPPNGNSLQKAL